MAGRNDPNAALAILGWLGSNTSDYTIIFLGTLPLIELIGADQVLVIASPFCTDYWNTASLRCYLCMSLESCGSASVAKASSIVVRLPRWTDISSVPRCSFMMRRTISSPMPDGSGRPSPGMLAQGSC